MLVTAGIAILCFLPHGLWVLANHRRRRRDGTLEKMRDGATRRWLPAQRGDPGCQHAGGGADSLRRCGWWYGLLWLRRANRLSLPGTIRMRAFSWRCMRVLSLHDGDGAHRRRGKIKDRWMQPLLFSLPLACFVMWPALARPESYRRILQVAAGGGGHYPGWRCPRGCTWGRRWASMRARIILIRNCRLNWNGDFRVPRRWWLATSAGRQSVFSAIRRAGPAAGSRSWRRRSQLTAKSSGGGAGRAGLAGAIPAGLSGGERGAASRIRLRYRYGSMKSCFSSTP